MTDSSISRRLVVRHHCVLISVLRVYLYVFFKYIFLPETLENRGYPASLGLVSMLIMFKSIISTRVGYQVYHVESAYERKRIFVFSCSRQHDVKLDISYLFFCKT